MEFKQLEKFIWKVFNYYNGRINIINKAVLDINWVNLMGINAGGYSVLPNIVCINPMVAIRYYGHDEFLIKVCIIETIIHELYHTDQIINYRLYMADADYNKYIEHACETQTAIYMAGHTKEFSDIFGLEIYIDDYDKIIKYWDRCGVHYQRRYLHDHIFMCFDNLCGFGIGASAKYQAMLDAIKNNKNITINFNGKNIPICINGKLINIEEFNNIMLPYWRASILDFSSNIIKDEEGNIVGSITVNNCLNIMCKKV